MINFQTGTSTRLQEPSPINENTSPAETERSPSLAGQSVVSVNNDQSYLSSSQTAQSEPVAQGICGRNITNTASWSGSEYKNFSTSQRVTSRQLLDSMEAAGIKYSHFNQKKVLDLGCGVGGDFATFLEKFGCDLYAIDPNSSMLKVAQQTADEIEHQTGKKVRISSQTAQDFQFDHAFALVISVQVFHWLPEKALAVALKNMYNHLEEGGYLVSALATSKEGLPYHKALHRVMNLEKYKEAFVDFISKKTEYTVDDMEKLVKEAGFKVHVARVDNVPKIRPDRKELEGALKQVSSECAHIAKSDPELAASFREDLVCEYLKEIKKPNLQKDLPWVTPTMTLIASKNSTLENTTDGLEKNS